MQVGTSILPRVNCDVAVMWRIPPPNSSSSYKVSAVFPLSEIGDIFGRPLGLGLCHRKSVRPSVRPSVCNVGVLWPNGLSDRDDFWHTPCPGQQ